MKGVLPPEHALDSAMISVIKVAPRYGPNRRKTMGIPLANLPMFTMSFSVVVVSSPAGSSHPG